MIVELPPGLILMLGALLVPLLRGRAQAIWAILLPAAGLLHLLFVIPEEATFGAFQVLGYDLLLVRVDPLSRVFGIIFHIVALLTTIYAFHVRQASQHVAGLVYAGSGIAAVFAGDLVTLFVWWELTAISSVFLIWARKTERSYRAGMRYVVIQVGSGVLLLAGVILYSKSAGTITFGKLIADDGTLASSASGVLLIFFAFGIKCAFPFLHNWLQDAYP
jgi:multicomponent Na+:H+ antiporter subunit D